MDTTLNFPNPGDSGSLSLSASLGSSRAGGSTLRQKTDSLLQSTYSMMYEMQKARDEREAERKRQAGKAAS
jgi:vacuolar-type H+-ATPase subunit D/Vma8